MKRMFPPNLDGHFLESSPVTLSVIVDPAIEGGPLSAAIFSLLAMSVVTTLLFLFDVCFLLVDFAVVF